MSETVLNIMAERFAEYAEQAGVDLIGIVLVDRVGNTAILERDPVPVVIDALRASADHLSHMATHHTDKGRDA